MAAEDGQIHLLDMEVRYGGDRQKFTTYIIRLSQGCECWAVTRRYSELRKCHGQLLEQYRRDELPPFPPKEPVFQKLLGKNSDKHSEFEHNRKSMLHRYLSGLLEDGRISLSRPIQHLLEVPTWSHGPGRALSSVSSRRSVSEESEREGIAPISGCRVRLTGEPGQLEVIVRTGSQDDASLRSCSVNIILRELANEKDDLKTQMIEKVLDVPTENDDLSGEVCQLFTLPPGTLWEVFARGITSSGAVGEAVSLRVRAPGDKEYIVLQPPPENLERCIDDAYMVTGTPAAEDEAATTRTQPEEDSENGESESSETGAPAPDRPQPNAGPEDSSVKTVMMAKLEQRRLRIDTLAAKQADAEGGSIRQRAMTAPEGSFDMAEDEDSDMGDGPRRSFLAGRNSLGGSEDHKIVRYRGLVAAAYMERVAEKQQMAIEKTPHRFEKADGAVRSVHVKFSKIGAEAAAHMHRDAIELDQSRKEKEMMMLQQDEARVAHWISAITGHESVVAAAAGEPLPCVDVLSPTPRHKTPLLIALQSGEALCDLINVVWPGRISGILRGQVTPFRRVENIMKFTGACTDLGMDEKHLFSPAELAAGRETSRNVVRCLIALDTLLPDPSNYDGPRLADASSMPPFED